MWYVYKRSKLKQDISYCIKEIINTVSHTVFNMSLTRAYVIFIALVIFSMKIQAHPKISRQTSLDGSKWRPFNSNMNSLSSYQRTMDMMPGYPVALQRQGFQQVRKYHTIFIRPRSQLLNRWTPHFEEID